MVGAADKILFTGKVVDNEDPFVLGRIRVFPNTDEVIEEVLRSEFSEEELVTGTYGLDVKYELRYTERDPFIFLPLMPSLINCIPQENELVWVTYSNPKYNRGRKEQFYIPGSRSNAFNFRFESYEQSLTNTNQGFNLKLNNALKNSVPNLDLIKYPKKSYFDDFKYKGIFAEPGDVAIYGRGSTDIILKENEIILRSGKTQRVVTNQENPKNENRGFLQLSYFDGSSVILNPEISESDVIDETSLKNLIEYDIFNPDGNDAFLGKVSIYNLPPKNEFKNNLFTSSTEVPADMSSYPIWEYDFRTTPLPMTAVTFIINSIIDGLNDGIIDIKEPFTPKKYIVENEGSENKVFPFYYRPGPSIRNLKVWEYLNPGDSIGFQIRKNMTTLTSKIKFSFDNGEFDGSGLVSRKNKSGISKKKEKKEVTNTKTFNNKNSVTTQASNKILLLAYDSIVPGKEKVNLSSESIYGLNEGIIYNNIIPNTEPLVRGNKLKEFLSILTKFLTTHVHPYPGLPPNPTSFSDVTIQTIESKFQQYDSEVLNQNIRINWYLSIKDNVSTSFIFF